MNSMIRSMVAILCIFCTLNALGSTTTLENQKIKYMVGIANQKYDGAPPTANQAHDLSADLTAIADAAKADGTLQAAESAFMKVKEQFVSQAPDANYMYQRLVAHGWKGTKQEAETWVATSDVEGRRALVSKITKEGLYGYLTNDVANAFQELGNILSKNAAVYGKAKLVFVNIDDNSCGGHTNTYTGIFLALGAIGAVASLGGVNPLGDLLVAGAAVGLFILWAACE